MATLQGAGMGTGMGTKDEWRLLGGRAGGLRQKETKNDIRHVVKIMLREVDISTSGSDSDLHRTARTLSQVWRQSRIRTDNICTSCYREAANHWNCLLSSFCRPLSLGPLPLNFTHRKCAAGVMRPTSCFIHSYICVMLLLMVSTQTLLFSVWLEVPASKHHLIQKGLDQTTWLWPDQTTWPRPHDRDWPKATETDPDWPRLDQTTWLQNRKQVLFKLWVCWTWI